MAERKNSEKRIATNNRWTNAHYDRINIAVPKGRKDEIKALADIRGQSINAYINRAIDEQMQRDGSRKPPVSPQEATGAPTEVEAVSLPSEAWEAAQEAAEATAGELIRGTRSGKPEESR